MQEPERPAQARKLRKDDVKRQPHILSEDDHNLPGSAVAEEQQDSALEGAQTHNAYLRHPGFRQIATGEFEATEFVEVSHTNLERAHHLIKRLLIGVPLATTMAERERLPKFKALAILSSDAISSVAFASEAILINLATTGSQHLGLALPISLAIIVLLVIVALSYRQTIPAYPNGGGSYTVARENLGLLPGLTAAAALMIDYVLNAAVCIAAGMHNLTSLFPGLNTIIVPLDIALIVVIVVLNLRGQQDSATLFALPTYFFIASASVLILTGLVKAYIVQHQPLIGYFAPTMQTLEPLSIIVILRSFSTGCSAMTGVEAISNGIPIFRYPQTRNATITLTWMAAILGMLFLGITLLVMTYAVQPEPSGDPTVIAKIAMQVFTGPLAFLFIPFQLSVVGVLILSAETSFTDFPRLASLLARDRFLPKQFSIRGDRLTFSVGIICLAVLAGLLLIVFRGDTNALINLFAVGVFLAFTLSQAGMVMHWWRLRRQQKGWKLRLLINGIGASTTGIVVLVIGTMKFLEGAWIVVVLLPIFVLLFRGIHRHYRYVEQERTVPLPIRPQDIHHRFIVPIDRLDHAAIQSLAYARSISPHVTAVHVVMETDQAEALYTDWERWQQLFSAEEKTELRMIPSPYRSLIRPLLDYIDGVHKQHQKDTLSVVLPEFVVAHWWEHVLHNQTALRLKAALWLRPGIIVINLPHHLRDRSRVLSPP